MVWLRRRNKGITEIKNKTQILPGSCNPSSTGWSLVLNLPQADGILEDFIGYTPRCHWEEELRGIMTKSSLLGLPLELLGAGAEQTPLNKSPEFKRCFLAGRLKPNLDNRVLEGAEPGLAHIPPGRKLLSSISKPRPSQFFLKELFGGSWAVVSEAPGLDTALEPLREGFSLLDRSTSPPCGMTWSPQSFRTPSQTGKKRSRMDQRGDKENETQNCWRTAKRRARVLSMHSKKSKSNSLYQESPSGFSILRDRGI